MSLHKEIKNAYDQVHAPDALVERMKQELYQKDFHEEADEMTWQVAEAPKRSPRSFAHIFAYVAATLVLCAGSGMAVWHMRDQMTDFHPGTNVPMDVSSTSDTMTDTTEETTESLEGVVRYYYQDMFGSDPS